MNIKADEVAVLRTIAILIGQLSPRTLARIAKDHGVFFDQYFWSTLRQYVERGGR